MTDAQPDPRASLSAPLCESRELTRLRAELASERAQAELRSRIFRLLSHEFRTPLTVILSSTELLQTYGERWDAIKRNGHLGKIAHSVELLSALLDDVLLFNKVQAGALQVAEAPPVQSLRDFLQSLIADFPDEAIARRIRLDCPALDFALDADLLAPALRNLLHNALHYTQGAVELRAWRQGQDLWLQVDDEGPGFPEEERQRLFEPFFRGSASQGIPGTGLGLAVVQGCTHLLGGEIRCLARSPQGSSFQMRFEDRR
jgi:signal transduction histidine kinase